MCSPYSASHWNTLRAGRTGLTAKMVSTNSFACSCDHTFNQHLQNQRSERCPLVLPWPQALWGPLVASPLHSMPPGLGISGGDGSLGVALPPQKVWQPLSWPSSWGGRQEARAQGPCGQMTGPRGQLGIREAGLWSFLMELHGPGGRGRGRRWRNWIVPGSRSEAQCYVTGFCNTTLASKAVWGLQQL